MPTLLPSRRRFWRRYTPAPETVSNLLATLAECALALAVVTATVVILAGMDFSGAAAPKVQPTAMPLFGP